NLLKPVLSTRQLKSIGATPCNEYRGVFEKDHALSRRFQKIDVVEPSVDETVEILKGLKTRFEAHHSVKYTANALTTAAELSARYINDRHLPDKAIDVIDEAGAAQRIAPKAKQKRIIEFAECDSLRRGAASFSGAGGGRRPPPLTTWKAGHKVTGVCAWLVPGGQPTRQIVSSSLGEPGDDIHPVTTSEKVSAVGSSVPR